MTLTPIPEEFTKVMHARAVQYGGGRSGYESFTDGGEWAYRLLSDQGLRWVKIEDGCEMPEIDEHVLWRTKEGYYFVKEIDKDDYPWWTGYRDPEVDKIPCFAICTHWARIPFDESPAPIQ